MEVITLFLKDTLQHEMRLFASAFFCAFALLVNDGDIPRELLCDDVVAFLQQSRQPAVWPSIQKCTTHLTVHADLARFTLSLLKFV